MIDYKKKWVNGGRTEDTFASFDADGHRVLTVAFRTGTVNILHHTTVFKFGHDEQVRLRDALNASIAKAESIESNLSESAESFLREGTDVIEAYRQMDERIIGGLEQ